MQTVDPGRFKLENIKQSKNGHQGQVKADVTECGVVIARLNKKAGGWFCENIDCKFLSGAAESRFGAYSDSLTQSEVLEMLYLNAVGQDKK